MERCRHEFGVRAKLLDSRLYPLASSVILRSCLVGYERAHPHAFERRNIDRLLPSVRRMLHNAITSCGKQWSGV
ncbi:hypothetical protein GQ600_3958 [Phytophthora cactorum]|nr:hypothetical protein GQ600_3958 [Phytophthora cactorum]